MTYKAVILDISGSVRDQITPPNCHDLDSVLKHIARGTHLVPQDMTIEIWKFDPRDQIWKTCDLQVMDA